METSVWGAAANVEPAYYHEAAEKLLGRTGDFNFFITNVVVREVAAAAPVVKETIKLLLDRVSPAELEVTTEVLTLVEEYIKRDVFPRRFEADAVHVAAASFYGVDYLVSYNFRHIVRVGRRELIRATNAILGVRTPEIISPEELAEEDWT